MSFLEPTVVQEPTRFLQTFASEGWSFTVCKFDHSQTKQQSWQSLRKSDRMWTASVCGVRVVFSLEQNRSFFGDCVELWKSPGKNTETEKRRPKHRNYCGVWLVLCCVQAKDWFSLSSHISVLFGKVLPWVQAYSSGKAFGFELVWLYIQHFQPSDSLVIPACFNKTSHLVLFFLWCSFIAEIFYLFRAYLTKRQKPSYFAFCLFPSVRKRKQVCFFFASRGIVP